jgi:biofilm protein TabA
MFFEVLAMLETPEFQAEFPRHELQVNRTNRQARNDTAKTKKDMSILGKVEDLAALVHPESRLRRGLDLLQDCLAGRLPEVVSQLTSLPPGANRRVTVNGDSLYLLIQCYTTRRRVEGRFEAHARHADLQFLWSGHECIEVFDVRRLQPSPTYDESGNAYFPITNELHSRMLLQAGEVAILLPQDAHAPCLSFQNGEESLVRKIVVKVKDAHLPDSPVNGTSPEASNLPTASPALND